MTGVVNIINDDVLAGLRGLDADLVHCVVTSPPYWGLRDYGVDGQIGLESTVQEYVERMVAVFREVRRVLRPDGTLWLNLGDCYATGAGKVGDAPGGGEQGARWRGDANRIRDKKREYRGAHHYDADGAVGHRGGHEGKHATKKFATNTVDPKGRAGLGPLTQPNRLPQLGLKPKDLVGMPWRVAFALQADGWYLRRDVIWSKPNPMPESCTDRPTTSHEYLFLLTKQQHYFYDDEAVREADSGQDHARAVLAGQPSLDPSGGVMSRHSGIRKPGGTAARSGRSRRSRSRARTSPRFPRRSRGSACAPAPARRGSARRAAPPAAGLSSSREERPAGTGTRTQISRRKASPASRAGDRRRASRTPGGAPAGRRPASAASPTCRRETSTSSRRPSATRRAPTTP